MPFKERITGVAGTFVEAIHWLHSASIPFQRLQDNPKVWPRNGLPGACGSTALVLATPALHWWTDLLATPEGQAVMPRWMELTPTGRMVEVAELQGEVVYLAAPASDAMTGHDLTVDGGYTLW